GANIRAVFFEGYRNFQFFKDLFFDIEMDGFTVYNDSVHIKNYRLDHSGYKNSDNSLSNSRFKTSGRQRQRSHLRMTSLLITLLICNSYTPDSNEDRSTAVLPLLFTIFLCHLMVPDKSNNFISVREEKLPVIKTCSEAGF